MKTLLFALVLFLTSNLMFGETEQWLIYKHGGELHGIWPFRWVGYNDVVIDYEHKVLECGNPGDEECKHESNSCKDSQINYMINYADVKIMLDSLTGSYNENIYCEDNETYYYSTVTWEADESYEGTITVSIQAIILP